MPTTLPGTYLDRPLPRFEQQWEKPDLIILDEFGIVPAGKSNAEPFFDVIATANKRNSTVLTSALKMDRNPWERTTYRPPPDRFAHGYYFVETSGARYRLSETKRRQEANLHS